MPFFKKLEDHYCFYDNTNETKIPKQECELYHGKFGPLQVNGMDEKSFHKLSLAVQEICNNKSQPWNGYKPDYTGNPSEFASCTQMQQFKDRLNRSMPKSALSRGNSKTGYLKTNVLERKNLFIFVDSTVTRIIFNEEKRAIGVEFFDPKTNGIKYLKATKEVIISAGVFHTPHLLQVSGVGDPSLLSRINVPVIVNNTYVGKRLWDHIFVPYILELNECDNMFNEENGPFSLLIQYNSGLRKELRKGIRDIQISILDATDGRSTPLSRLYLSNTQNSRCSNNTGTVATFRITLNMNDFRSGTVEATSSSIFDKPIIDLGWKKLSDKDKESFLSAIKLLRSFNETSSSFRKLVSREVLPGSLDLDEYLETNFYSALHPVGTCGMGLCIDENLKVYGTQSLRVCDASSFPVQIDGNPSATIFAMAEILSDRLLKEHAVNVNSKLRAKWKKFDNILIYQSENVTPRKKVAAFSLNTLINSKNQIKNCVIDDKVISKIKMFYSTGYKVVIFHQEKNSQEIVLKDKLTCLAQSFNVPVQIFVSSENMDKIWNTFTWLYNEAVDIDYESSFYVGYEYSFSKIIFSLKYYNYNDIFESSKLNATKRDKHFNIIQTINLEKPADDVWKLIGNFFSIDNWHPDILATKVDGILRRQVVFSGEYVNTIEQLTLFDPKKRTYNYKNVGGNWGKYVRNYESTLSVIENDNGKSSIVIWSGSFDSFEDSVTNFYRKGLDSLSIIFNSDPCIDIGKNFTENLMKFKNSNLHIYWRQDYSINAQALWAIVGVWKGKLNDTYSMEPGAEYSFTLPNTPRIYERLVYYNPTNLEFYYCMKVTSPRSLPVINYLSMKKVVPTGNSTAAWIRTGLMITDGSTSVNDAAYQVLNDVYVAGGERLRIQLNSL